MKIINIKDYLLRKGEFIAGSEATGTHACYLIYGVLEPLDERKMSPGSGHEEIYCILEGEVEVESLNGKHVLSKGQCIYLKGEEEVTFKSRGMTVIYVASGGHSEGAEHHHN